MERLRSAACCSLFALLAAFFAASAPAANVTPTIAGPSRMLPLTVAGPTCPLPGSPTCYTPAFVEQAYGFPTGAGAPTGAGQTIVIVVAYGNPDLEADLAVFDARNGIAPPPKLTIAAQKTAVPGTGGSGATFVWARETAADVEYAHALAPGAAIVVATAASDDSENIAEIEREVLPRYPSAIVTQSFAADETGPAADPAFAPAARLLYAGTLLGGGTVLASAGDAGASNGTEIESLEAPPGLLTPSAMAAYPASDPFVLGVGGTMGDPYPNGLWQNGGYGGEQVWNEPDQAAATGGAPSAIYAAPPWQSGLTSFATRTTPDVSYNAAIDGGVVVVLSCAPDAFGFAISACNPAQPHSTLVGGTSVGAPQWAAIVALANELRGKQGRPPVGFANPALYALGANPASYARDFHDVTTGDNTLDLSAFGLGPSAFGFAAAPGFDVPSGLGTPNVSGLLGDLAALPSVPPADVTCSNQTLTGSYHNVTVAPGRSCTLDGAIVSGNLQANHSSALIVTGAIVGGNLQADGVAGGASRICGAVVGGNLQIHGSASSSPWTIGGGPGCASSVGGNLEFQQNASTGNAIGGNLVLGNLQCQQNGGVGGGGNRVRGNVQGQCTTLTP